MPDEKEQVTRGEVLDWLGYQIEIATTDAEDKNPLVREMSKFRLTMFKATRTLIEAAGEGEGE